MRLIFWPYCYSDAASNAEIVLPAHGWRTDRRAGYR